MNQRKKSLQRSGSNKKRVGRKSENKPEAKGKYQPQFNIGNIRRPKGTPSKKLLGNLLDHHGIKIDPEKRNLIWKYHQILREANHDNDLTRLHAFDTIVERHYVDCLWVPHHLMKKLPAPLLDLGTGAGFPGLMLAINDPSLTIILAEPRPRRVDFLNNVIKELNLKSVTVFPHKVTSESFTQKINGMICRAFASIELTLPRIENGLKKNGLAMFMKGPAVKEELKTLQLTNYSFERQDFYTLPKTKQHRSFISLRKKN